MLVSHFDIVHEFIKEKIVMCDKVRSILNKNMLNNNLFTMTLFRDIPIRNVFLVVSYESVNWV
jgi:hypothetical protein